MKTSAKDRQWARAAVLLAAAGLLGCAGAQKMDAKTAGDEDVAGGPAAGPDDPTAVLAKKPKAPERKVSEDERADFEKALAAYQKVRRAGALKGSDCDEAASAFRRAADQNPQLLEARHNEAAVLMECGKKEEAERIWQKLAGGNRPYAPALAGLGYVAWQKGDSSGAESYFTRSLQADQLLGSISARINLAQILRDKARRAGGLDEKRQYNDQAIRNLRAALALDGNALQAYATLCYIYFDLGLPEAARLIGGQAIKRAEEIATGKFDDELMDTTTKSDAPDPKAKKGKGKKDEAEAPAPKRAKQVAVEGTGWTTDMKKQIAVVHNTLGLVALGRKNSTEAISSFRKAVEMDPELYEGRLNLAAVSLKFRDYPTAEENFRAVLAAQPRNYEATVGLGVALRGNRKFDDAEKVYADAMKLDSSRPESYFNLGLLYQEYKGSEKAALQKAQSFYRDFLAKGGDQKMRRDAERRIKDIDDLFKALEDAARLQAEAERMQKEAEEQQKKMEEQIKKMEEEEKKKAGGGAGTTSTPPPSATPPPAGGDGKPAAAIAPPTTK